MAKPIWTRDLVRPFEPRHTFCPVLPVAPKTMTFKDPEPTPWPWATEEPSKLLMPELAAFAARWPHIELHIAPSETIADLGRREADVAIRTVPHGKSPGGDVAGRKAATIYTAVYGNGDQLLGWYGDERDRASFADTRFADLPMRSSMRNTHLLRAACARGMGLAVLPCFMAAPPLELRTKPRPFWDIWVLVHPDLRRSPRLRIFRDEIVASLRRLRPVLTGKTPATA